MNKNLTLLTDYFQLSMIQGYFLTKRCGKRVAFDLFYRRNPFSNGYAVAAGLAQAIEYINDLSFGEESVNYLRSLGTFDESFLEYLKTFKFTGDIHAIPEGTVVFPYEPLIRVTAPIIEAQLIETALLNIVNHQSLIATKAARVVHAAENDVVLEFGLRRAQGPDAGVYGARAALIGGCHATSNVLAAQMFNLPPRGTHAHSWVMAFDTELEAFREYAKLYPNACILLVDTYNTLKSGVPNAIKVFEEMRSNGVELKNYGIRLDSGDFAYLSKQARKMLDAAGFSNAAISASGDLDENLIALLKQQGAKITVWGVGTNLITSEGCPAFGGVYKLAAEENNGCMEPKIKISENPEKVTNPGVKKIYRLYDKVSGKMKADLITLDDETIDTNSDLTIFHPINTWKQMTLKAGEFTARELLVPIFLNGKQVYESPAVMDIRAYCAKEKETLWEEHKRLVRPHMMPVDLSHELWHLRKRMIDEIRGGV